MEFFKYQGTGNDFILVDNRKNIISPPNIPLISHLCDRKFGIGADGLILLEEDTNFDFRMRYFNSDGSEASMCGNGGRCITAFAKHLKIIDKHTRFVAVDGEHEANIEDNNGNLQVNLRMQDVENVKIEDNYFYLNTGSPHYVKFIKTFNDFDVYSEGKAVRYSESFAPKGVNVNFVKTEKDYLVVNTYERGVENETLSCGTGVVASVLSSCLKENKLSGTQRVKTKGGDLRVSFQFDGDTKFSNIWLEGTVSLVFKGYVSL